MAGEGEGEHEKPPEVQQERLPTAVKLRTLRDKRVKKNVYQKQSLELAIHAQ